MLICPCTKQRLLALQYMPSLDNIREDHSVEMTDMRGSINIENRRGDVVGFLGGRLRSKISAVASAVALTR